MEKMLRLISLWAPPVCLMVLIFIGSTAILSGDNTSRILVPLLKFLFPFADLETLNSLRYAIRKCAHVTEYSLLAALLWRAVVFSSLSKGQKLNTWPMRESIYAFILSVLYAISDEFHQSFVPSRTGSFYDVLFDSTGAALGILCLFLFFTLKKRKKKV